MLASVLFKVGLSASLPLMILSASKSASTVDLSFNRKWICESDIDIRLNEYSGILWIIVRSRDVDEKLPFHSCKDSHCDWGNGDGAEHCKAIPCAEVMASRREQQLLIRVKDFEARCTMVKSIHKQDVIAPR
ncbi:MAG TPA: hypothetical protein VM144_03845 [Aestuariivirga sp.]|nr:hypothetical protein [Aestuariivirga sp.]